MTVRDCLTGHLAEQDPARAKDALDLLDQLEEDYRGSVGPSLAGQQAEAKALEVLKAEAIERARRDMLQAKAWQGIELNLKTFKNGKGETDYGLAAIAHLDRDELARFSNVEARRKARLSQFQGMLSEHLAKFHRDLLGRARNKADQINMVREIFGEDTGDQSAKELTDAWANVAERARLLFNQAGGRIPKRADWGLPQAHDTLKVRKATYEEWRDFTEELLDLDKMIDEATGLPLTGARLELAMKSANDAIRSDGWSRIQPSGQARGRAVGSRHTDHRFFVFKNADAWLKYQDRFGTGDPFSTMMSHLDHMAREIAQMEILGPNPTATIRKLQEVVKKDANIRDGAAGTTTLGDRAERQSETIENLYGMISGSLNAPIDGRIANVMAGTRQVLVSAQLGSAAISAITDLNFQRIARRLAGLPQMNMVQQMVRLMNPLDQTDQKIAVRLGLMAENWSQQAMAQHRYTGEMSGPEFTSRLSDFVLRVSGLSPWTQAGKHIFGMEFMGALADHADKPFKELPALLRNTMEKYRIDEDAWNVIRATKLYEPKPGATFLRPDDLIVREDLSPSLAEDLATRILEMVQTETEFAVPSVSLRGRAPVFGKGTRPGQFLGEVARSGFMYKNFAVTIIMTHGRRMMAQQGWSRVHYGIDLMVSTAVMGAFALQMKELSKGRDPRDMTDPGFAGAALLQGGGLGIFGDFFFSDVNRFGNSKGQTLAGPVVGLIDDVTNFSLGNMLQLASGENANVGREATNLVRRYTPGGSIWYARLAWERLFVDRLQSYIDPDARKAFRRQVKNRKRDYGQDYWWKPGRDGPSRAPNFNAAFGGK